MEDNENIEEVELEMYQEVEESVEDIKRAIEEASTDSQMERMTVRVADSIKKVNYLMHKTEWYGVRIKTVALEIMNGMSPSQISNKYYKKWGVTRKSIEIHYVIDARTFLATEVLTDENDIRVDLLGKYQHLYRLNMVNNNLKEARTVLDSIANLTQHLNSKLQIFGDIQTIQLVEVKPDENKELTEGI